MATVRQTVGIGSVLTVILLAIGFGLTFTSHDEPIVFDNGPITVRRVIGTAGNYKPPTMENNDPKRWHLHHSLRLRDLHVRVWASAAEEDYKDLPKPVSLSAVDAVVFNLIDTRAGGARRIQLRRDAWWEALPGQQAAHLESPDVAFKVKETSGSYSLGLDPENPDLHIREIDVEGTVVCLRDQHEPSIGKCATGTFEPYRIAVAMCTKSDKQCPTFTTNASVSAGGAIR